MDIQSEKLDLIRWIAYLEDESVILSLIELKDEYGDNWNELTPAQKARTEQGFQQAEAGESKSLTEINEPLMKNTVL